MATTTNYGWTTPDDTALVKDGAAAIRTLGTSVDTTTKNLNPSTTLGDIEYRSSTTSVNTRLGIGSSGQNLSVVAGVPSWVASATSTLTTTGDTLYASAANTLARRAIGTTGQVLTVSGGLPTWTTPTAGGGLTLINTGGTALTGAATVSVSSIPGTYKNLHVYLQEHVVTSTGDNGAFRFNSDASNTYAFTGLRLRNNGTLATEASASAQLYFASELSSTNTGNFCYIMIPNYASNSHCKVVIGQSYSSQGSYDYSMQVSGTYRTTGTITSVQVFTNGTAWTGGTIYVYGEN
jgi:hypothetical protein